MKLFWVCGFIGCLLATGAQNSAQAQTVFGALTAQERTVFGAEIRAVLLDTPEIVAGLSDGKALARPSEASPIAQAYAQAVADDLALIRAYSARLFDPEVMAFGTDNGVPIALFIAQDCADCTRAQTDLRALAKTIEIRVAVIDIAKHRNMATALGIDSAPSYVLPNMMIRGQMPNIVLERYLTALKQNGPTKTAAPVQP